MSNPAFSPGGIAPWGLCRRRVWIRSRCGKGVETSPLGPGLPDLLVLELVDPVLGEEEEEAPGDVVAGGGSACRSKKVSKSVI